MRQKSIELLNKAVADELAAVHQYMYFHFRCDNLGYAPLSNLFKRFAIEEMMHVERIAERILFLKGEVEMVAAQPIQKIHDVMRMLVLGAKMESDSVKDYNNWALECDRNADAASKLIFEQLVQDEERHFDLFDLEIEKLEKFGDSYLVLQSIEHSKSISEK